jgi:hypothetical protein
MPQTPTLTAATSGDSRGKTVHRPLKAVAKNRIPGWVGRRKLPQRLAVIRSSGPKPTRAAAAAPQMAKVITTCVSRRLTR